MEVSPLIKGARVVITALPFYLKQRKDHGYCLVEEGMEGTVISQTASGTKLGIQFDNPIWKLKPDGTKSNFDNACSGRGKQHFCAYIPSEFLERPSGKPIIDSKAVMEYVNMRTPLSKIEEERGRHLIISYDMSPVLEQRQEGFDARLLLL